jgi:hypothetical protein
LNLVLTLISRKPAAKLEVKDPEKEKSLSSDKHLKLKINILFFYMKATGRMQAERLDRNQWKQYTALMADSGRFVDMLHGINWQEGLNLDVANGKRISFIDSMKHLSIFFSGGIVYRQRSRWYLRRSFR